MRESALALQGMLVPQLMLVVSTTTATAAPTAVALNELNCLHHCGDISTPYSFGVEENCNLDKQYLVTCNESKPYFGNMPISHISLDRSSLVKRNPIRRG